MKILRLLIITMVVSMLIVPPSFANEVDELKEMILEMKESHAEQIKRLEEKIDRLEANQEREVEEKVADIKDELREDIKEEIKSESWSSEYVGRDHDAEVGKGGFMAESPQGFSKVTLGGYIDHEFEDFQGSDSTFDQHRWIITIGALIGERLRFFSEYEIEHGGPDNGGEAKVEQAYMDYLINDWVNLRLGAVLVPFGYTNIYHDSDLRDLTSRPIVARDIIPTTWTESGVGFFGEFNPTIGDYEDLVVNYEAYVINGLDEGFSDTSMKGGKGSLESDNNSAKSVVGRVTVSPMLGHTLGLSGYYGKYNDSGDAITGGAVDFLSEFGPLEILGEFAMFDVDVPMGMDIADEFKGFQLQASYHFWPEFLNDTFLGRNFDDPTFTLVGRYGEGTIDDDSDAGTGDNEEERWTLGLNYRPVESWVFKMEYQWNETENESLERGDSEGWFISAAMGF